MKKTLLAITAAIAFSTAAMADQNQQVLDMANQFDKRITGYEYSKDMKTVILYGDWPVSFAADNTAKGWCPEFDNNVMFVHLLQTSGQKRAAVMCK